VFGLVAIDTGARMFEDTSVPSADALQ